ncbi:MAG TPA: ribosome small subunit-dependent GTPase A [Candidatus Scatomorpha merdavium]|jgi:ribosome biogenesis GTPase|nr:ribosome small subunit-dependent GTPase A [Oscillospiraceae bacterium]HIS15948.1 ribosome small subunit-dependent GTPase A [Candidatus Scatomorpha merdavium]
MQGVIIKALSGFYYVKTESGTVECRARGRFRLDGSSPLVGDRVEISLDANGKGRVDKLLPRKNFFIRPAVANIDLLIAVASEVNPVTDPFLIDRVTAFAEHMGCEVLICINKSDAARVSRLRDIYATSGYRVIETSAVTGEGVEELRGCIAGKVCAFSGNSGVGKSSLLNALEPGLGLETGVVSEKLGRGRHTTRHVEIFPAGGAFVADTPGFASFDMEQLPPIPKEELQFCFPEFGPYIGKCRFDDCAHLKEPGCAVREAMDEGKINASRHLSYARLYEISAKYKEWEK